MTLSFQWTEALGIPVAIYPPRCPATSMCPPEALISSRQNDDFAKIFVINQ
jgi:hypothetical protein